MQNNNSKGALGAILLFLKTLFLGATRFVNALDEGTEMLERTIHDANQRHLTDSAISESTYRATAKAKAAAVLLTQKKQLDQLRKNAEDTKQYDAYIETLEAAIKAKEAERTSTE